MIPGVQPKLLLNLDTEEPKYRLIRERDKLVKESARVLWLEWNEDGTFKDNFDVNICSSMNIVEALHLTGSDSRVIHVASATEQSSHKGIHESEYSLTKGKGTANFHRSLRSSSVKATYIGSAVSEIQTHRHPITFM